MAIALVKSAVGVSAVAVTSPAFGSATTSGNLIVLGFAADDYNGTPDSGWTQSTGMEQQTFHGGYIWWRISTGQTSFQYTIASATVSAWVLAEFSGVDPTPYDTSNGQLAASSATSYTTPAITPSTGNRVLVAMMGGSLGGFTEATVTFSSWLNSFTFIDKSGTSAGGTNDIAGLAYRLVTGNGSSTFSTGATYSFNQDSTSGLLISFKEGASATNTIMFADQARS